jgi:hypothetical protein
MEAEMKLSTQHHTADYLVPRNHFWVSVRMELLLTNMQSFPLVSLEQYKLIRSVQQFKTKNSWEAFNSHFWFPLLS